MGRKPVTDEFRRQVAQVIEELKGKKHGGELWKAVLKRAEELRDTENGKSIRPQNRDH